MKAHIITIHHITNFGSVFQATALCCYLNEAGIKTDIIDYRPAYFDAGRNRIRTMVGKFLNLRAYNSRKRKYESFIKSNEILSTRLYVDAPELLELDNADDLFIAGGDQLWNSHHPCGNDSAYKLNFVQKGKKVAYGTSIGRDNLLNDEWKGLSESISDFEHIGLREQSTVTQLKMYSECDIEHVLDPVALYDNSWYEHNFIHERDVKEKYAVVYLIKPSALLDSVIDHLRSKGYYIIQVSGMTSKSKVDKLLKDSGPDEILNYIYHADFVLSGSFHATLFSILFNKKFATILPEINTNARIENLVKMTHLQHRIIQSVDNIELIDAEINYDATNEIIEEKRTRSKNFIKQILEKKK